MTHLLILCEGEMEDRIIKKFLKPYWSQRFSSADPFLYSGNGELRAKFAIDAMTQLTHEPDSSVLCMVDLHEDPFKLYQRGRMTYQDGFQAVQKHMYSFIDSKFHQRFGGFPVIMEPETWLLADAKVMEQLGQQRLPEPETIEHPAEYLKRLRQSNRGNYSKIIDGKNLFDQCSAKRVYDDNCPHFKYLVDWLIVAPDPSPELPNQIQEKLMVWEQKRTTLQDRFDTLYRQLEDDHDPSEESLAICIAAEKELKDFAMTVDEVYK